jgi:hypothetical protein
VRDRATLYLKLLGGEATVGETEKDVNEFRKLQTTKDTNISVVHIFLTFSSVNGDLELLTNFW